MLHSSPSPLGSHWCMQSSLKFTIKSNAENEYPRTSRCHPCHHCPHHFCINLHLYSMNQELQNLLDKVDEHFKFECAEFPSAYSIDGKIDDLPARISLSFKLGGYYSAFRPQVCFCLSIDGRAVSHWGCMDDEDTEQLTRWWYMQDELARSVYTDRQNSAQLVWDLIKST